MGIGVDKFVSVVALNIEEAPLMPVMRPNRSVGPYTGHDAAVQALGTMSLLERLSLLEEVITEALPAPAHLGETLAFADSFEVALNLILQEVAITTLPNTYPDAAARLEQHLEAFYEFDELGND